MTLKYNHARHNRNHHWPSKVVAAYSVAEFGYNLYHKKSKQMAPVHHKKHTGKSAGKGVSQRKIKFPQSKHKHPHGHRGMELAMASAHADGTGGNADALHSGAEAKHMFIHLGHKHHPKAQGSYFRYTQDHCLVVNSSLATAGQACYVDLFTIGSYSNLTGTTGTNYGAYQSDSSYLSLNPSEWNTGSTIYGAATGASNIANDRIFLKRASVHLDMTSTVSTSQYLKLRVYKAKRDLVLTPLGVWGNLAAANALQTAKLIQPVALATAAKVGYQSLNLGVVSQGGGITNAYYANGIPMIEAAGCAGFSSAYEVLKERSFILAPGASERIVVDIEANWMMKQSVENLVASAFPKGTLFFQLEMVGAVETVHAFTTNAPSAHSAPGVALVARQFLTFESVLAAEQRLNVAYGAAFESSGVTVNQVTNTDTAAAPVSAS